MGVRRDERARGGPVDGCVGGWGEGGPGGRGGDVYIVLRWLGGRIKLT